MSVSVNDTVPLGSVEPAKAGVITAVKATGWLTMEGFGNDETFTVVPEATTISAKAPGAPAMKFESPPYVAVMVLPGDGITLLKAYGQDAVPGFPVIVSALQSVVPPCMMVTLPVGNTLGVPPPGAATVTWKVTGWFTDGDAGKEASVV